MEVNNSFPTYYACNQAVHYTKAIDLYSFWIICRKTIVNPPDFYSLNLQKIFSGDLGWSSRTVKEIK